MTDKRAPDQDALIDRILHLWRADADTLPSEPRLAELTGASRNSVREALIRLEERGYVHRTQGARTSPNRRLPGVGRRIDEQFDHSLSIRAAGYEPTLEVVSADRMTLAAGTQRYDDLPDGADVLRTTKMWRVDGAPYALAEDLVPVTRVVDLDPQRPVFDLAEAANGIRVAWETMWIDAIALDAARAAILDAEPGTPVIEMTYCGYGADDAIGYWSREVQLTAPAGLRNALIRRVRS
ncbi:GntR family transcriptional regulator [Microbacterium trichothecenolyticum]|uniref:GntR family transcriptional regulator n=1 Tax=Microbacterium trichothecenolyticum TaxID=69370 RepID=A0ABU0TVJ2_MICTR|nr:UTRA domain-containing protein [Microbacterium trichothecenolyticum]MDQ1123666.1 GntR family transcriptional regulator [Microbacterium trichothecenolyticum]